MKSRPKNGNNMAINWSHYSLEELRQHASHTFRQGGGSRPDVLLIEIDGHQAVLKDQSAADPLFSTLIGPILNWRECKALTKLSTLECTPNLLAKPSTRSFLMSYHRSEQITRLKECQPDWPDFFTQLEQAIQQLHAAGVAHNDLRNPTNTLVTPEGKPILVDLVAAFCRGRIWNLPNHWLFNKFCQVDLSALTKLKSRLAPDLLNDGDLHAEHIAGRFGMGARQAGQLIRKLSRKLFTN